MLDILNRLRRTYREPSKSQRFFDSYKAVLGFERELGLAIRTKAASGEPFIAFSVTRHSSISYPHGRKRYLRVRLWDAAGASRNLSVPLDAPKEWIDWTRDHLANHPAGGLAERREQGE